tara:strand:+ start:23 stop:754 length:732 start_codon:yes stop_codon:yes gene_type:complete
MEIINKVLITGASGGIGSSICDKFIRHNFKLVLTSSSLDNLNKLKEKYGVNHSYFHLDLSNTDSLEENLNLIKNSHKDISVIVNNAGITEDGLILRMKSIQWNKVIDTNLTSNFVIIKKLLPNMISNKRGKIIGISSVVALSGNPGQSNYVASKSGMIGLYKSIAHEVASRNISVNIVSPGFIVSPMTDKISDVQKDKFLENIPMKKFGEPSDVANLVYFLSSNEASYITGQNFHVNGGMLMV